MIIVISLSKAICVVFKRVNLEMQLQDLLRDFYIGVIRYNGSVI